MVTGGAYGIKTFEEMGLQRWLGEPGADWLEIDVGLAKGEAPVVTKARFDDEEAWFTLLPDGVLNVRRQARNARFFLNREPDPAALVHPGLSMIGASFARWRGWETFHCAAVIGAEGAFGILASRGGGKSSTLVQLLRRGYQILTDDVLIVTDGLALKGPRCIDLRPESIGDLLLKVELESARYGERLRLLLPDCAPNARLVGFVSLDWGEFSIDKVPVTRRPATLAPHRYWRLPSTGLRNLLDASVLPMWHLSRPKGWASMEETLDAIERIIGPRT